MTIRSLSRCAAIATAAIALAVGPAHAAPTPITGNWVTGDGSGLVQIAPCGQQLCGRLARVLKAKPGSADRDVNNPDAALRNRPIVGLPILTGFVASTSDWRGRIYDPRNGKTYKSIVGRAADGTLKVQGCIAFFCQTQVWRPAR